MQQKQQSPTIVLQGLYIGKDAKYTVKFRGYIYQIHKYIYIYRYICMKVDTLLLAASLLGHYFLTASYVLVAIMMQKSLEE